MMSSAPSPRETRSALFEQFARIGHALASPKRIELIELLEQSEKSVEALSRQAQLPIKSTSAHLRVLRTARIVETRREGKYVFYRLAGPQVSALARSLVRVARERLTEVAQISRAFLERRDTLSPLSLAELRGRMRRAEVLLLDVRPRDEYATGHIRGARSVPLSALPERLGSLPKGQEIVAYCRGPYCVLAPEAVALLRRRGFKARRLEVGFPEARDAGLPVAAASAR
jgi:rhodanese-related sulfurtransferase/DNA-binding transcriptional ArsR family regulator